MVVGDAAVAGHAAVHLHQFLVQQAGAAMEHPQHRGGTEGPAAGAVDADRRAAHQVGGAAVHPAHGGDVVIHQKAFDQVALAQQVAALLLVPFGVFLQTGQQQGLVLQHPGDLFPVEHAAHQHQQGRGVGFQCRLRPGGQVRQRGSGGQGGQLDAGIFLHYPQTAIEIAALPVGGQGAQVAAAALKPLAVAAVV